MKNIVRHYKITPNGIVRLPDETYIYPDPPPNRLKTWGGRHRLKSGFNDELPRVADPRAVKRIFAALDSEADESRRARRIERALAALPEKHRAFARGILAGGVAADSGLSKSGFNKHLKKIIQMLESPANIG